MSSVKDLYWVWIIIFLSVVCGPSRELVICCWIINLTVWEREGPDVSGPIRSIKMYSYAQCARQEGLVCCEDVPCLAHMEQGSGPLHSEHLQYTSPYLPGVMGTQFTSSLQEGWIWTVEWTFATSPTQIL
jgi:hypothetical protein